MIGPARHVRVPQRASRWPSAALIMREKKKDFKNSLAYLDFGNAKSCACGCLFLPWSQVESSIPKESGEEGEGESALIHQTSLF